MNPAERYAFLKALQHGVSEAVRAAETEAHQWATEVRAKSLETDVGTVTVTRRKSTVQLDPEAFLEWVQANRPDEIITTLSVRSSFAKAFTDALTPDGDDWITGDGELVDFARLVEGKEFLTTRLTDEVKAEAADTITARLELLTEGLLAVTHG